MGAAIDVPPPRVHCECRASTGAKIISPVAGSATAETSAEARPLQPVTTTTVSDGASFSGKHPEPLPAHAVSSQPVPELLLFKVVPPTAMTCRELAG